MRDDVHDLSGPDSAHDLRFRPVTMKTLRDVVIFRGLHPPFGGCSCMRWRIPGAEFNRLKVSERSRAFDALVENGTLVGILAYLDDAPVGWCSIAPRHTFAALKWSVSRPRADATRIWSVTCFCIVSRQRGRGISVRLLRAAVEYARSEGAKAIEGYPVEPGKEPHSSLGSPDIFRRAGFLDVTPPGRMRRVMSNVVR